MGKNNFFRKVGRKFERNIRPIYNSGQKDRKDAKQDAKREGEGQKSRLSREANQRISQINNLINEMTRRRLQLVSSRTEFRAELSNLPGSVDPENSEIANFENVLQQGIVTYDNEIQRLNVELANVPSLLSSLFKQVDLNVEEAIKEIRKLGREHKRSFYIGGSVPIDSSGTPKMGEVRFRGSVGSMTHDSFLSRIGEMADSVLRNLRDSSPEFSRSRLFQPADSVPTAPEVKEAPSLVA